MKLNIIGISQLVIVIFLIITASCSTVTVGPRPNFTGVDPEFTGIVSKYKTLADLYGIKFDKEVTIGFSHRLSSEVMGETQFEDEWREISINSRSWDKSTLPTRYVLLLHELTHAYCDRGHDFDEDKNYPQTREERIELSKRAAAGEKIPGYLEDGCPSSIMFPSVLPDFCTIKHIKSYIKEMFQRCEPY